MADALSQNQILAQLKTRGFEAGFSTTPLRDFKGRLTDIGGEMREGNWGSYLVVLYNVTDVEVIESVEPYTSPIAQIEIPHSSKAKSKMGYFGNSIDRIINATLAPDVAAEMAKNQDYLVGKTCRFVFTPGHMLWNGESKQDLPTNCWEILEVAGEAVVAQAPVAVPVAVPGVVPAAPVATAPVPVAAAPVPVIPVAVAPVSAAQQALVLLDGKNLQAWHQVVFVDPVVKASPEIINSIIGTTFLPPLEAAGQVTKDADGTYHVVKA